MRRKKCPLKCTLRRVANRDICRCRLLENETTVNCWWKNNIMSSCEQSKKGVVVNVVGSAENIGSGFTTRLREVTAGTIRPQSSELWKDKSHPQQTSRNGALRRDGLISVTPFITLTVHSTAQILKFSVHVRPWILACSLGATVSPRPQRV